MFVFRCFMRRDVVLSHLCMHTGCADSLMLGCRVVHIKISELYCLVLKLVVAHESMALVHSLLCM